MLQSNAEVQPLHQVQTSAIKLNNATDGSTVTFSPSSDTQLLSNTSINQAVSSVGGSLTMATISNRPGPGTKVMAGRSLNQIGEKNSQGSILVRAAVIVHILYCTVVYLKFLTVKRELDLSVSKSH